MWVGVSVSNTGDLFNIDSPTNPPASFRLDSLGRGHGTGVLGKSTTGFGVHAISTSNTAVVGQILRVSDSNPNPPDPTGFGVHGIAITNTAVVGNSETGFGVHGISGSNTGVVGSSDGNGFGVHGIAKTTTGVVGESAKGIGVHGISQAAGDGSAARRRTATVDCSSR